MNLKKFISFSLVIVMMLSLIACGKKDESADTKATESATPSVPVATTPVTPDTGANSKIQAYIDQNGASIVSAMEQGFVSSSGMTCKSTIEAKGDGVVIKFNVNELDNVPQENKNAVQTTLDASKSALALSLKEIQQEVPEIKSLEIYLCEKDGDLIAKVTVDESTPSTTPGTTTPDIDTGTPDPKIQAFVDEQGQAFVDGVAQGFAGSGMTCKASIEAKGNGVVVVISINELENVSQADKDAMQANMPTVEASLKTALATLTAIVPEIKFMQLHICDKNGDVLASGTVFA